MNPSATDGGGAVCRQVQPQPQPQQQQARSVRRHGHTRRLRTSHRTGPVAPPTALPPLHRNDLNIRPAPDRRFSTSTGNRSNWRVNDETQSDSRPHGRTDGKRPLTYARMARATVSLAAQHRPRRRQQASVKRDLPDQYFVSSKCEIH